MRRYKCRQYNQPGIDHQLSHFTDAANVLFAIVVTESQIAAQPVTHIIAVKQIGAYAKLVQRLFQRPGDGGFTRPREAGKPQHHAAMAMVLLALLAGHRMRMPDDVFVMPGHYLPPSRSRASQCGKCFRIS